MLAPSACPSNLDALPARLQRCPPMCFCRWLCGGALLILGITSVLGDVNKPEPIRLFNGKDLSGLSTWLRDTRREDPRRVFSVHDGLLQISGDGFGYVATEREYQDYHLVV